MSNRLTFSLASLILIFAFGLVAMPAMAHTGHTDAHPTVTIEEAPASAYTATDVKARDNFKVKITFSIGGSTDSDRFAAGDDLAASELTLSGFNAGGGVVTSPAQVKSGITFADTRVAPDKHEWIVPLQIDEAAVRTLRVQVDAGAVNGAHSASQQANEVVSKDLGGLPSVLPFIAKVEAAQKKDAANADIPGRFTLTLTLKKADDSALPDSEIIPLPTVADIMVMPMDSAEAVDAAGAAVPSSTALGNVTADDGIFTQDYQMKFGVATTTLSVIPGYFSNAPDVTFDPNFVAPTPVTQNPPEAAITVMDHDPAARTFRVDVAFTPALDSEGNAGTAITGFDLTGLDIVDDDDADAGAVVLAPMALNQQMNDNSYKAILQYSVFAELPLTVTIDQAVRDTSNPTHSAMVGSSTPGPGVPANAPGAPTGLTATADQASNQITLTWTAPADDGGSAITGYTITKEYTAADGTMATKMIDPGLNTTFTIPPPGEPALPQGVTFTFTVTATNANGTGPASNSDTAMIDVDSTRVTLPDFVGNPVGDVYFWVDEENHTSENFPLATDSLYPIDSSGYSVDPPLPSGLVLRYIDNNDRVIAGTPDTAQAKTSYKLIYTAPDGATAETPFTITIVERLVPGKLLSLTAEQNSHIPDAESIDLSWDALDERVKTDANNNGNDGGSPVTHYEIMWSGPSGTGGTISTASEDDPDATMYTLEENLLIGEHEIQVRAVNAIGDGAYSDVETVNIANPPGAPRDLRAAIDQVTNRVTLEWLAPYSDGGDPILGYVVYITEPDAVVRRIEIGLATVHRTSSLTKEGQYSFRITAVNNCGEGPKSIAQEFPVVISPNKPPVFDRTSIGDITATVGIPLDVRNALPSATDPEGEPVEYTISPTLPMGVNFNSTSRVLSGTPTSPMGRTLYTYAAWDGTPDDPGIMSATLQFSITVHPSKPPTINIPTATSSSAPIPLGPQFANTMIPGYGFAVLVRDVNDSGTYDPLPNTWMRSMDTALPDLAWFFGGTGGTNGGTIALNGPATAKDLLISEIMWGTDSSLAVPERSQWIEFYNATPNPIDLTGFTITFHRSQVPAAAWAGAVDVVSNAGRIYFGHSEFPGQSGRTDPVDTDGRYAATQNLISMFRDIDHVWVQHHNVANRGERNKRIGGWLEAVYPTANIHPGRVATPGAEQIRRVTIANTTFSRDIIINEIGNSANDDYDWIELHNTTANAIKLRKWDFTMIVKEGDVGKEKRIFQFPDNDTVWVPANGYLVIARSHPRNDGNDLAAGIDVTKSAIDQLKRGLGEKDLANHPTAYYYVNSGLVIPNDTARRLFVLRNANDKHGQPTHVVDAAGTLSIEVRGELQDGFTGYAAHTRQLWNTATWPFQGASGVHGDVITDGPPENFRPGHVYQRNGKNSGIGEHHISVRGYTGIGYDRHAAVNGENGGTPGYSKDAVKSKASDLAGMITISEIMLATDELETAGRVPRATRLPQWIEIYNSSLTQSVNLKNWYIEIQNADSDDLPETRNLSETVRLTAADVYLQPNQTILIVSSSGLASDDFPGQRVINLFTTAAYRNALNLTTRGNPVLSQVGFWVQLRDAENNMVDTIGNLAVSRRTGQGRRDNFDTDWDLTFDAISPVSEAPTIRAGESMLHSADGQRSSLIRVYDNKTAADGLLKSSWRSASETNFRNVPSLTFYGNHRDFGTPGYRGGGPLPVSLSKFRPERLESGDVVIRWTTESELNNAGFNILRSETRTGEYKQVNTQLIKGQGTTSERTTYTHIDTSAKPNVVYYYQIQDVSIDGKVQTLQMSRLKGNVTPAGKATTTWGELKALQ